MGDEEDSRFLEIPSDIADEGSSPPSVTIAVEGVPRCMLPQGDRHFIVPCGQFSQPAEIDVPCLLWVYWVPPEEEEEEEEGGEEDEEMEAIVPEGLLCVAADAELVPEEAMPVEGSLEWASGDGRPAGHITLDGRSLGPFEVCSVAPELCGGGVATQCLLGRLQIHAKPPDGFGYRPRECSPLAERVAELGGCELARLVACPVAVGYLRPVAV